MPVEIPADLPAPLLPLVWLLGRWEGAGVGGYPTVEEFRFGQEVEFGYTPGKPFLAYTSRSWLLDDDGAMVRPLATETGFWRPQPEGQLEVLSGWAPWTAPRSSCAPTWWPAPRPPRTTRPGTGSTGWSRAT